MDVNEGEHQVGEVDRGSRKRKRNMTSRRRKKEVRYVFNIFIGYDVTKI